MKSKIKVTIFVFIMSLFLMMSTSNAQTMGELTRLAVNNLHAFFNASISSVTDGNTDGGGETYANYCMDPFDHGWANHNSMRTAVVDVGANGMSSVNNLSTTNSEGARRAMEVLYYAAKSYMNREPWGATGSSPYRLMMMQTSAMYSSTMVNAGLFNSSLPGGVTESYMINQFGGNRYRQLKSEGESYVNSTVNYAFTDKSQKNVQTMEEVGDWIFIGPYKVQNTGAGHTTKAVVTTASGATCTADGWASSPNPNGVKSITTIPNGSTFYLAFRSQKPDSAKKVELYKRADSVLRARMVFYASDGGQNMSTYGGEITSSESKISLPEVPFSYIRITKTDADSGKALKNVGFIVYNETEGKWVQDGTPAKYVDSRNDATVYRSNSNGEVNIRNLNKKGVYTIYEIVNPNFGYIDASVDDPSNVVEANIKAVGQTVRLNITNKRTYIKLSGYVWEDIVSEKQSIRNYLYNQDANDDFDKLLANITVSLRDKNGNLLQAYNDDGQPIGEIQPRKTNSQGRYEFGNYWAQGYENEKIRIQDIIDGAYIEFEYNGMTYKSVPLNPNANNGSKATDDTNRNKSETNNQYFYSTRYATVTSNEATDTEGRVTSLEYDFANNKSTLRYADSTSSYIYGYDGQRYPIDGIYDKYKIFANTKDANNGIMGKNLTANDIYKNNMEEIPYINLGLYEREMPDLAVTQDVQNAKITLNGYEHIYQYAQRFDNPGGFNESTGQEGGEDGFNVAVKFGEKYGSQSYTRAIYSSDLVYNGQQDNDDQRLKIYITYRIAVRNEATGVYTRLNALANYYDDDFELVATGEGIDSEGNIINPIQNRVDESYNQNGYKKSIIYADTGRNINPVGTNQSNTVEIYVQYRLNNNAVNAVLNGDVTLSSITEVSSYSSFEGGFSTVYSGVDKDSRPDSITTNDRSTYEDDTDSAPTLILQVHDARLIRGTIWEDSAIQELVNGEGYNKRREGDGVYNSSSENVIQNVKVELLKEQVDQNGNVSYPVAELYQTNSLDEPVLAEDITGSDGIYEFDGVIPGKYLLRYTYGNNSVIYDTQGNRVQDIEITKYKSTQYRDGNKEEAEANNDYWYRQETSRDTSALRLSDARDIRGLYGDDYIDVVDRRTSVGTINYEYATYENTLSEIQAETRRFDIKIDYDVNLDNISSYNANLKFEFDNIDLGIIRRPVQEMKVTKEISHIEIVLANGQTVISGDPRTDDIQHLKMLPDGRVYIEIDNEIIQGATLNVEYEIKVDSTACEVDYNNQDYYYYNTVPANNADWKMATVTNLYDYIADDLNYDEVNQEVDENGNLVYGWNSVTITNEQLQNGEFSEDVYNAIKNYTKILETDYFDDMTPENREKIAKLNLTRLLSNNELDFAFDNDVESHTGEGRIPDDTIPGNYIPSESPKEPDEDDVEIIITGPTGENQQYLPYIILIISGAVILISGIIFIKKKIIKSDD